MSGFIEKDLYKLTKAELLELAKAYNLSITDSSKKEIIELILSCEKQDNSSTSFDEELARRQALLSTSSFDEELARRQGKFHCKSFEEELKLRKTRF